MNHDDDVRWMRQALHIAQRACAAGEVPVGAVLVRDNVLVGSGWNQPISSHDPSAHAEIVALRQAAAQAGNYRLPETTLYVTIEPCTMCFGALIHARVKHIVFGAPEPKAGVLVSNAGLLGSRVYNHDLTWRGGILENECAALMQDFFQSRRAEKRKAANNPDT